MRLLDIVPASFLRRQRTLYLLDELAKVMDTSHVRALRLWHWQQVLENRAIARKLVEQCLPIEVIDTANKAADFHLDAVITLNSFFPIGDTAERDKSRNSEGTQSGQH